VDMVLIGEHVLLSYSRVCLALYLVFCALMQLLVDAFVDCENLVT